MEKWYQGGRLSTLDQETYVALIAEQLTYFPPETVIERLTGDGDARTLVAPLWSRNKRGVLNAIAAYQKSHDLVQGMRFSRINEKAPTAVDLRLGAFFIFSDKGLKELSFFR